MKYYWAMVSFLIFMSCENQHTDYLKIQGEAQGTTFTIIYKDSLNRDFSVQIQKILQDFDQELSTYIPTSLISVFNNNNKPIELSKTNYFKECLTQSIHFKTITDSTFDPFIKHILDYKKANATENVPDSILAVDREISIENNILYKKSNVLKLDFNAIAQGYSVDVLANFLEQNEIENYMVEIGGEVKVKGKNQANQNWVIGIESPDSKVEDKDFQEMVSITNKALATSGSYRKFKEIQGKKYSHAIDPINGQGVTHNLLSVTVVTNHCADADALATAFLVMGEQKATQWIIQHKEIPVEAYFISFFGDKYSISFTDGFKEYITPI